MGHLIYNPMSEVLVPLIFAIQGSGVGTLTLISQDLGIWTPNLLSQDSGVGTLNLLSNE